MNLNLINQILYLTHDKWDEFSKVKSREEFKTFLINVVEYNSEIEKTLEMILEYSNGEDRILMMVGVFEIIKKNYPEDYKYVMTRIKVKSLKEELGF